MVSEFLFYEEDADKTQKSNYIALKIEIRDLLREDFNRKILVQILLDLRKDVSGDTQKQLFKLYRDLGLEKDAFKKLESWRWELVSKGILELTMMQVEEAYSFIVKFINDRRGTIRKQAEIATVTLKSDGISYFLDTTKYKISEWQQLKLLDVLRNNNDFEPPRFKAWLTSTNTHVVLFALRLIKYYNQNDASASLIELVKHKDRQVKQQAIDCIKEFHITEALPTLKGVFPKCTVDTKLGILGAIAELGDTSEIEFLQAVAQHEGNFSVKSKAVGAINTIAPESIMPTENIEHITAYQAPTPTNDQIPTNDPPVKPTPMKNPKKTDKSLKNIAVEAEEVTAASGEDTHATEPSNFDISEIHFLPIVVVDEKEGVSNQNLTDEDKEITHSPESMEEELQTLITEINEMNFLPVVTDEENSPDNQSSEASNEEEFASLEAIEGYSLSDFDIAFEKKNDTTVLEEDEKVEFDLEDTPIIDVENPKIEDVMSWLMADNELREIECHYDTVPFSSDTEISNDLIPEPVYYNEHEAYMMSLLDDLEELGDHREIALLEELRVEESKRFIKNRIDAMIDKFAQERNTKKPTSSTTATETENLPVFSVFADLFKSIDSECKLILLDEVVAVGDEKEIEFLDGLLEDPDQRIRNKAQTVLKLLIGKLSYENPSALCSKGISDVVAEQRESETHSEAEKYDHLLSEMDLAPAVAPEIFNIDFELCEVLDKNCEQKILDIPVIATEVSPNENGGSFFTSLRKFSKLLF